MHISTFFWIVLSSDLENIFKERQLMKTTKFFIKPYCVSMYALEKLAGVCEREFFGSLMVWSH